MDRRDPTGRQQQDVQTPLDNAEQGGTPVGEEPRAEEVADQVANGSIEPETTEDHPDWEDRYLRLAAELENRKKAFERAYARRTEQERERLIRDILPLADNLERALQHVSAMEKQTGLYSGVELTLRNLLNALARHGVQRIEALGEPFDPEVHEAVATLPHPSLAPGTVMRVEQPGYLLEGRLLRPAQVLVTAG